MKWFEIIASTIVVVIVLLIKAITDFSWGNIKALIAEAPVDISIICLSLNFAFMVLFLELDGYRTTSNIELCIITFLIQIAVLVFVVIMSKKMMDRYRSTTNIWHYIQCLFCTYLPSLPVLIWSINVLTSFQGVTL